MNIVTKSELKRFIELSKIGIKHGRRKEIRNYTSVTTYDGTDVPKEYYISLELRYFCDADEIQDLIEKENFGHDLDDIISKF
jgi:hypothetical protein